MKKLIFILKMIFTFGFYGAKVYMERQKEIDSVIMGTNEILIEANEIRKGILNQNMSLGEIAQRLNPTELKDKLKFVQDSMDTVKGVAGRIQFLHENKLLTKAE